MLCGNPYAGAHHKSGLLSGCAVTSLLALPAAMSLGVVLSPTQAQAQAVINTNQYSSVDLANYGAGPVQITAGTTISPATGTGVYGTGTAWSLTNAGDVQAAAGVGILLNAGGTLSNVAGATISASTYGVLMRNAGGSVDNAGLIEAGNDGISLNHGGTVSNAAGGTISGGHMGVYTGAGGGSISNSGVISTRTGTAVSLYGGGSFTNSASGQVSGGYSGVYAGVNGSSIQNAGIINGASFGAYLTGADSLTNTGSLGGGVDGVIDIASGGVVDNSGVITGTNAGLRLGRSSQMLNSGSVSGGTYGVELGNGSTLTNETGGLIQGGGVGVQAGNDVSIVNAGTILDGTQAGIVLGRGDTLNNSGSIAGVTGVLASGGYASIFSTGTIATTQPGGDAISLLGTAIVMHLLGQSLNLFTIIALVLAVGLVVDDAIVVVEDIFRRINEGESPLDAASASVTRLAPVLAAISSTLVVAFLPLVFLQGLTAALFRPFATVLITAFLLSLIIALTIVPLIALWAGRHSTREAQTGPLDRLRDLYARLLRPSLRHPALVVLIAAGLAGFSGVLYARAPRNLTPAADGLSVNIFAAGPYGASLAYL
ncbi:MAG: hypothetical protein B7Z81_09595, partial [Acidocella sp. 20-61-6]